MIRNLNIKKFTNKYPLNINGFTMVNVILSKNKKYIEKVFSEILERDTINLLNVEESINLLINEDIRNKIIVINNFCYDTHYSEIPKFIDIMFRISKSNNLQFFISTQSTDVLKSLENDISKNYEDSLFGSHDEEIPLSLYRIGSNSETNKIDVVRYNAKEFVISLKYGLEIR